MIQQHTPVSTTQPENPAGDLPMRLHPNCVVCSPTNSRGLRQAFVLGADDSVTADFDLDETCEGYQGYLHGGVTAALLDASMCHWLFAHDLAGVTAELNVRFRHPMRSGEPARAIAQLKRVSHPLYILEAHIVQDRQVRAQATGKFMCKSELVERTHGGRDV